MINFTSTSSYDLSPQHTQHIPNLNPTSTHNIKQTITSASTTLNAAVRATPVPTKPRAQRHQEEHHNVYVINRIAIDQPQAFQYQNWETTTQNLNIIIDLWCANIWVGKIISKPSGINRALHRLQLQQSSHDNNLFSNIGHPSWDEFSHRALCLA